MNEPQEIALTVAIGLLKKNNFPLMADDLFELRRSFALAPTPSTPAPVATHDESVGTLEIGCDGAFALMPNRAEIRKLKPPTGSILKKVYAAPPTRPDGDVPIQISNELFGPLIALLICVHKSIADGEVVEGCAERWCKEAIDLLMESRPNQAAPTPQDPQ